MSDETLLKEIGHRISKYRLNKNQTQDTLAKEAGVSQSTVVRIEHGQSTQTTNLFRILRVLRILENVEALIPEPPLSPIQQLQMHGKSRKRASTKSNKTTAKEPWSWGNEI